MKIRCNCGNTQKARLKDYKIPEDATVLRSNYCPKCDGDNDGDFYEEWFENIDGNRVEYKSKK